MQIEIGSDKFVLTGREYRALLHSEFEVDRLRGAIRHAIDGIASGVDRQTISAHLRAVLEAQSN